MAAIKTRVCQMPILTMPTFQELQRDSRPMVSPPTASKANQPPNMRAVSWVSGQTHNSIKVAGEIKPSIANRPMTTPAIIIP